MCEGEAEWLNYSTTTNRRLMVTFMKPKFRILSWLVGIVAPDPARLLAANVKRILN